MQDNKPQDEKLPISHKVSQWKLLLASVMYFIIQAIVVLALFWFTVKSWKENSQIEKSVMKPEMIEGFETIASGIIKMYDTSEALANNAKNIKVFENNVRRYGIEMKSQEFEYEGQRGTNIYGEALSRKESRYRHYILAFNKDSPWELATVHIFLTEFFNRNTNMGLSLILLGYDGKFKNYNIAVREFLSGLFSHKKIVKSCNFVRDGLAIEVAKSSAAKSALFYYPCKLIRWQRWERIRL